MYRINILSDGKHHNVVLGYRYCFRKKTAMRLIDTFLKFKCNITVHKLVRLHGDIFCWADEDVGDKVFDYYDEKREED